MIGEAIAATLILAIPIVFLGWIFGLVLAAVHNMTMGDQYGYRNGRKDWHPYKRVWKIATFPLRVFRSRTRRLEERLARACVLEDHLTDHVGRLASDDPWKPYFDTLKVEATRKREAISTDLKQAVAQGYAKKIKEIGE